MQSSNTKLIKLGRSGFEDQNVKGVYINRMSSPDSSVASVVIKNAFFSFVYHFFLLLMTK